MKLNSGRALASLCLAGAVLGVWAIPAGAQTAGASEKPRLYTYAAFWTIPRARWDDMAKATTANQKIFDAAVANGTIVGYGNDETLVHHVEGPTHDNWWAATWHSGSLKGAYVHGASYKLKADAPNNELSPNANRRGQQNRGDKRAGE
jgi:hypothetical protein